MNAIVATRFGGPEVLEIQQMPKPVPGEGEVLVKVFASPISSGDSRMRRGSRASLPLWPVSKLAIGVGKPNVGILGFSHAGVVEAVGPGVTGFKPGDAVFGGGGKSHAEYIVRKVSGSLTHKPANLSFEEACGLTFGAASALYLWRQAGLQNGHDVLVYGASGSVGLAAVQLAKHFGARVTAVCSGANVALVRGLGADEVIDYQREDFTKRGATYDVIMDTVGKTWFPAIKHTLKPRGVHSLAVMNWPDVWQILLTSLGRGRRVLSGVAGAPRADVDLIAQLCAEGKFKSIVDSVYPYTRFAEAHARVDSGRKRGDVVLQFATS